MAFVYQKKDPKDASKIRWMGKLKIGGSWEVVSLRFDSRISERKATQRITDLQYEVDAGVLSERSREWLGEASFNRLSRLVGTAAAGIKEGSPNCWESALAAYLKSTNSADTRVPIPGKAREQERTKMARKGVLGRVVKWAIAKKEPFLKRPYTEIAIDYIEHRKAKGIASTTLWGGDWAYINLWGEWMADNNLCAPPIRKKIRQAMPRKVAPHVVIPSLEDDLKWLGFLRDKRHTNEGGPNWKKSRRWFAAWSLVTVVRGLGCRPSEASSLSWDTVDLQNDKVEFLDSKTGKHRTVPILFQWVKDALMEMARLRGENRQGAVCLSMYRRAWGTDSQATEAIRRIRVEFSLPPLVLKQCQKLWIDQLINLGFPRETVSDWCDHSSSVSRRHYEKLASHLPPTEIANYGEFGVLSDYGKKVLEYQMRRYSMSPQLVGSNTGE